MNIIIIGILWSLLTITNPAKAPHTTFSIGVLPVTTVALANEQLTYIASQYPQYLTRQEQEKLSSPQFQYTFGITIPLN